MSEQTMTLAQKGFGAWVRGDFGSMEAMFDPGVSWQASEQPGDWDCHGREEVMRTLRERHAQGLARSTMEFVDAADDTVIVVGHPREVLGPDWPEETATAATFRDGKVVLMQGYRTRQDAIDSLSRPGPTSP
jgi:ketosteroid isomerase-like protein